MVTDPKNDFNACHDFLRTVVDGYINIVAAFCKILGAKSAKVVTQEMLFPNGIPKDRAGMLRAIEKLASEIELRYTQYSTSIIPLSNDGIFNYSRLVLSMGLLARDFRDSWKEGDGSRSLRLWKFLLLHFKQSGHHKYAYEAFRLLAHVHVILTPKQSFELMWNRVCSIRNGLAHNIPLDLQMEHLNRIFKDDLKTFHSHLAEQSVCKTANAAGPVNEMLTNFDKHTSN